MERKAMNNEEIRGRLVERADYVAEQEEIEHFIFILEPKLKNLENFSKLKEILEDYSEFRRNHYVNFK